jgi:hypothetical protein
MGLPKLWGQDLVRHRRAGGRAVLAKTPPEPPTDGCPGAWYRSAFAISVSRYERTIMRDAIASNPLLDRCADPLVLEAAAYLEGERLRHRHHWNERFGS